MRSSDRRFSFLVTGAGGFIGKHLVSALRSRFLDAVIVGQTRAPLPQREEDRVLEMVCPLSKLARTCDETPGCPTSFDGVFHLAAATPKSRDDDNLEVVLEANILGLKDVLTFLKRKTKSFVFASTLDVYGAPSPEEILNERSALRPQSLYACSKLMGEVIAKEWGRREGVRIALIRIGHIFGPGEGKYEKLIPNTIRRVIAGKPALLYGDGRQSRDFLHVSDAARGLIDAWAALEEEDLGPLNLVNGQSVVIADVVRLICEEAGVPIRIEHQEAPAPAHSYRFDASLLREALGFKPLVSLREGLRSEIDWFRTQNAPEMIRG